MMLRAWLRTPVLAAFFVAAFALLSPGRARAQLLGAGGTGLTTGTGGSGGTTFSASDFFIGVQQTPGVNLSIADQGRFFNKARCDCASSVQLFVAIQPQSISKRNTVTGTTGTVSLVLGPGCTTLLGQVVGNCVSVPNGTEKVTTFLNNTSFTVTTDAHFLSTDLIVSADGGTGTANCESGLQFNQTLNVNFDFDGDGSTDVSASTALYIDLAPPPAPTGVTIKGGDEALVMNWAALDTSVVNDLLGYQILCSRADQYPVFPESPTDGGASGSFGAGFVTCPPSPPPEMGVGVGVENLNPIFVCSPMLSAEATSYRVKILQNDITYAAAVVAIDNSGNASAPIVDYGTPIKTLSFYEVYRNGNPQDAGGASGGFCALATSRPRLASTLGASLAFGLGAIGLIIARKRRGRR
jgi:hypothetical protein